MKVKILHDVPVSRNIDGAAPATCAYPLSTVLPDGTIVTVYRGGEAKHTYDGVLMSQRSTDMGSTWSEPQVLFNGTGLAEPQSVTSGGAAVAADGSILAMFKTTVVSTPDSYVYSDAGRTQKCLIYSVSSRDGGASWSEPAGVDAGRDQKVGVTTKPLLLPSGRMFVPLEAGGGDVITTLGAFADERGQIQGPFRELGLDDRDRQLDHCDARFASMGDQVLALLWTFRHDNERTVQVHRAVSADEGETWSRPAPIAILGQITAPLVLDGQTVIAASNYRLQPPGVRLWCSTDGAQNWQVPPIQMWDPKQERILGESMTTSTEDRPDDGVWDALDEFTFGTPDLVRLADGSIVLTYYGTANGVQHVRACRFEVQVD